jgi:hypothetical protein
MPDFTLRPSKAPNLLVAPIVYDQRYIDQLTNALRLYFNQVDNVTGTVLGNDGGKYVQFPHIAASDLTDQYADADNDPTIVKWNTLDSGSGFTLNPSYTATCLESGIFKIDYSLQYANTANAAHDVVVWLKVNGVDVPRSASKITLPARKSAGVPSYLLMYSTVTFEVQTGDEIGLWWATDLAYNPVGPVDGVYMEFIAAQTVPYPHPSVPSAIGAITFVSRLPTTT